MIENTSSQAVNLVDLVGMKSGDDVLRTVAPKDPSTPSGQLAQPVTILPPGGKTIVPLRIVFLDSVAKWRTPLRMTEAAAMYRKIQSRPRQSVATTEIGNERPKTIRKRRSAFGPPELPAQTEFAFGQEIYLRGLMLAKESISLGEPSFDLLTLTNEDGLENFEESPELELMQNDTGGVSCPILYSFVDGEWVNHGKVIDNANGANNDQTSIVSVNPKARRFRIAEEEPEVTTVKQVRLNLTLRDGRTATILPQPINSQSGATSFKVPAFSKVDLEFSVPAEFPAEEIVKSQISISGYYERYLVLSSRPAK
jgi:hypothetical protein